MYFHSSVHLLYKADETEMYYEVKSLSCVYIVVNIPGCIQIYV